MCECVLRLQKGVSSVKLKSEEQSTQYFSVDKGCKINVMLSFVMLSEGLRQLMSVNNHLKLPHDGYIIDGCINAVFYLKA